MLLWLIYPYGIKMTNDNIQLYALMIIECQQTLALEMGLIKKTTVAWNEPSNMPVWVALSAMLLRHRF